MRFWISVGSGLLMAFCGAPPTQACGSFPYTFANGTTADAAQVNANFAFAANCVNSLTSGATFSNASFVGLVQITQPTASIILTQPTSTSYAGLRIMNDLNSVYHMIEFDYAGSAYSGSLLTSGPTGESGALTTVGAYPLSFGTANVARMTISSSGNVGVGTATPSLAFYVNGAAGGTSAWSSPSDARLKKDIVPIANPLAIIEQLQGVRFDWRESRERNVGKNLKLPVGRHQIGFVAQDVRKVMPEAVTETSGHDAILEVQYEKVIPVLVEAMKQQQRQIASLRNEIQSLKVRLAKNATRSRPSEKLASSR